MSRVHLFAFAAARRDAGRTPRQHERRDLAAAIELARPLLGAGLALGEQLFNAPPERADSTEPLQVPTEARMGDVLLCATRPPLTDELEGARKRVDLGHTDLEARVLDAWRPYLLLCSRNRVALKARRARVWDFAQYDAGAPAVEAAEPGRRASRSTYGFLLHTAQGLWPGGPRLVHAFGLDGTATLAWARILATRHADKLLAPGFHVARLELGDVPKRAASLAWADTWRSTLMEEQQP